MKTLMFCATLLAQTARIAMAAFQIGALATKAVIKPLYTKQVWALMSPSTITKLSAVGMTNLLVFEAVRDGCSKPRLSNIANALTMFGTGSIYLIFPVKGQLINIPFVSSLFSVGLLNVLNILRRQTPISSPRTKNTTRQFPLYATALITTGISSFLYLSNRMPFSSVTHRSIISKVYVSQIAMNTVTAGIIELDIRSTRDMLRKHFYLAVLGLFCLRSNMTLPAAISTIGIGLSAVRVLH